MIIAIITNFVIIFSATFLFYWFFSNIKKTRKLTVIEDRLLSVMIGISFGLLSLVITILFLDTANNVLVNTRFISFLISGILGGPIAMIVNGIFIFFIRFILGTDTILSLIVSMNALVFAFILSAIAIYKPLTFKTIHYYFAFLLVEVMLLLVVINPFTLEAVGYITLFVCYSIALYSFLIYVVNNVNEVNNHARKSIALMKVDYLTQLPNSLALESKLQHYINEKKPFELIHLDIDLFKNINTTYSYRLGDQLLSQISQTIHLYADKHEAYVARIGGDEFCYVITNSSPANAIVEGHNLCKLIENTTYTIEQHQVQVTASASIISYPENATTLNEIYTASNYGLKIITEFKTNTVKHINQIKQEHPNY